MKEVTPVLCHVGTATRERGIAMKARLLILSVVVTAFLLALVNGGISTSPG